jgi:phasin family protein
MSTAAKKATTEKVTKQAEAAVNASKEGVETVMKAGTDAVAKTYEQAAAATREQVESTFKVYEKAFKDVDGYKEIAEFGKDNVEAALVSGAALVKGFQEFGKAWTAMAQASIENSYEIGHAALGCKSVQELTELQADYAKKRYNDLVADGRTLAGLSVKVTEDALAPVRARVDAAVAAFAKSPSA